MTEKFLNGADTCPEPQVLGVIPGFQEMRGKAVPKGVRADGFVNFRQRHRCPDCPLQAARIQMVTANDPTSRIGRKAVRWEDILPGQFTIGIRIFPRQSKGQFHRAKASDQVACMLFLHKSNLHLQRFDQAGGSIVRRSFSPLLSRTTIWDCPKSERLYCLMASMISLAYLLLEVES